MPRQAREDRDNTTSRGAGYMAMRLTPNEVQALASLVEIQQATIDATGLPMRANQSSVLRALLKREALERGVWPEAVKAPKADPRQLTIPGAAEPAVQAAPAPEPAKEAPPAPPEPPSQVTVLGAVEACLDASTGLAFVPKVVRALGGDVATVHQALLDASRAGVLELRHESGMGRLSAAEKALCIPGHEGTPLSWARLPVEEPKEPEAPAELDVETLRQRLVNATSQGVRLADIAERSGVNKGTLAGFKAGKPLGAEKRAALDAALREVEG